MVRLPGKGKGASIEASGEKAARAPMSVRTKAKPEALARRNDCFLFIFSVRQTQRVRSLHTGETVHMWISQSTHGQLVVSKLLDFPHQTIMA